MSELIPVMVLCGFLGSGKTTLLRRWKREADLQDAVWIVHDLSEAGIDAELLADEGADPEAGRLEGRMAALHGEHAREHLAESLGRVLHEAAELDPAPPVVLLESTGAARPWPLVKALAGDARFFLRHFIVTVDALNLHRDFADGALLADGAETHDPALAHAAGVLAEQLAFASVIVLTKTDTQPREVLDRQLRILRALRPGVAIAFSAHGGLLPGQLEGIPAPRKSVMASRARKLGLPDRDVTLAGVECTVFREQRPFHPQRLYEVCRRKLGTGLYRAKGFLWMASRPGQVLLWQQSGSQVALEMTGIWRAEIAANREGRLLPEELEILAERLRDAHPVFGDRHQELSLIGLRQAREDFEKALHGALCTDDEVEAWLRGEEFPDPWPRTMRRIS